MRSCRWFRVAPVQSVGGSCGVAGWSRASVMPTAVGSRAFAVPDAGTASMLAFVSRAREPGTGGAMLPALRMRLGTGSVVRSGSSHGAGVLPARCLAGARPADTSAGGRCAGDGRAGAWCVRTQVPASRQAETAGRQGSEADEPRVPRPRDVIPPMGERGDGMAASSRVIRTNDRSPTSTTGFRCWMAGVVSRGSEGLTTGVAMPPSNGGWTSTARVPSSPISA